MMEFRPDGTLVYAMRERGKVQKIILRFTTRDGVIITDQPSEPREERTQYRITEDDRLVLVYEGETTIYVRD
jgi:hypothetical protein